MKTCAYIVPGVISTIDDRRCGAPATHEVLAFYGGNPKPACVFLVTCARHGRAIVSTRNHSGRVAGYRMAMVRL